MYKYKTKVLTRYGPEEFIVNADSDRQARKIASTMSGFPKENQVDIIIKRII